MILLGTRGSALALAQTELIESALRSRFPGLEVEHRVVHTTGDLRPDLRLGGRDPGHDKAVWVRELESALRSGSIHAAVHSAKDVPAERPEGFRLAGCLPRAAVNDVLISKHAGGLNGLPEGAAVATSSLRRERQLIWKRPDLRVIEIRGNVPTRLQKLLSMPQLDALVLAQAGIDRLGIQAPGLQFTPLPPAEFLPAPAQGIVAVETFGEDAGRVRLFDAITDRKTFEALMAERAVLRGLEAGCHTPVGVFSECAPDGSMTMKVALFDENDLTAAPRLASASGPAGQPDEFARQIVRALRL
jgi:hydroxymethylbilane synthase